MSENPNTPINEAEILESFAVPPRTGRFKTVLNWIVREPFGTLGAFLIMLMVFVSVFAPVLNTTDPMGFGVDILQAPSVDHFFGTDRTGKDLWSRVLYGGRISLKIGLATVIIGTFAGTVFALLAGFFGGFVDFIFGRITDILFAVPTFLLALTLSTSIGADMPDLPGIPSGELVVIIAISVGFMPGIFRIMRGLVLEQRGTEYVLAAEVTGASQTRIMARHILPNMLGLMIVATSITLPAAILTESALSFLGAGVPPGSPSWGADLSGASRTYLMRAPWLAVFPGLALSLTVFGFNIFGDALRDTLDPRLRGKI
jgi:ABC-type dipeptide/oligopeptide/nickel transport system permease subunit